MPTVSVVMSVYNGETFLAEAIDSILAQTLTDFEFLIVDDGSQDNSAEIIRSYQQRDSRIRFFQLERNMGIADARNRAIAEAAGEYITIMDCDDISLPERLEKQVAFLRANPEIGVVGARGRAVSEDLSTPLFELKVPEKHCLIVFATLVGVSFIFTTIMVRAALIKAVGGYQPGRRAGEERDLCWRLLWHRQIGLANIPEFLYIYRRHESSLSHNRNEVLESQRRETLAGILQQLWGEAPEATLNRFLRLRMQEKLGWAERRAAKNDMSRLIESLIVHNLVHTSDKPLLLAEMNRRLEGTTPRLWQQFCHWRRHHFQRQ